MNYCKINKCDSANGLGIRVTLFVSGCLNHCKGCFQPETWNFNYGQPFTEETESEILDLLNKPYIDGLTILGGDPMEFCNQRGIIGLLRKIKETMPEKNIWVYTGYLYKDLLPNKGKRYLIGTTDELLSYIDILVDGPFEQKKKQLMLNFRGSSNQRIIDMKSTLAEGKVVLSDLNY